jgi:hypothetical protein
LGRAVAVYDGVLGDGVAEELAGVWLREGGDAVDEVDVGNGYFGDLEAGGAEPGRDGVRSAVAYLGAGCNLDSHRGQDTGIGVRRLRGGPAGGAPEWSAPLSYFECCLAYS